MSFDLPSRAEINRPAGEVSLMIVRRLFVARLERELDKVATLRTVQATGPVAAPDRREVLSTGAVRAFAKLAATWLVHPEVVAAEPEPSRAESGVRAVLFVGQASNEAAWEGADLGAQERLAVAAVRSGRDSTLARGRLLAIVLGDDDAFAEEVAAWWQDNVPGVAPTFGDEELSWLTEPGHGPERWVQELARAVVDAYFLRQYDGQPHQPVETLTELPFPLVAEGHRFAVESPFQQWLTELDDTLSPAQYPEAGDLVEACRRREDYLTG